MLNPLKYFTIRDGISNLRESLSGKSDFNVLVTILTDGLENHSREYKASDIKALIEELEKENWTFTYIGTEHNVLEVADSLSIKNTMQFYKSDTDINRMFEDERKARFLYSDKISKNKDTTDFFYEE